MAQVTKAEVVRRLKLEGLHVGGRRLVHQGQGTTAKLSLGGTGFIAVNSGRLIAVNYLPDGNEKRARQTEWKTYADVQSFAEEHLDWVTKSADREVVRLRKLIDAAKKMNQKSATLSETIGHLEEALEEAFGFATVEVLTEGRIALAELQSKRAAEKRANGPGWVEGELMDHLLQHKEVTVQELHYAFKGGLTTQKAALQKLVKAGRLETVKRGRKTYYKRKSASPPKTDAEKDAAIMAGIAAALDAAL